MRVNYGFIYVYLRASAVFYLFDVLYSIEKRYIELYAQRRP